MQLADMTTNIRLRKPYEAIDLGFTLARHYFLALLPSWLSFLLIIALLLWTVIPFEYAGLASLVIWWLKPLYDRVILHNFSHYLFGQNLSAAELFKTLPKLITQTGLFGALTWRRLSWSRSYNLPIWQLEGLRGEQRSKRQSLIYEQFESNAIFLTSICAATELVFIIALYGLLVMLDPSHETWENLQAIFTGDFDQELLEYWSTLIGFMFYVLVVLVVEPFFVVAGFMLYLNRRTQLEAWDLEIQLRQLGQRLANLAKPVTQCLLAGVICLFLVSPEVSYAKTEEYLSPQRLSAEYSREQIDKVMASEELSRHQKAERWVYKGDDSFDFEPDVNESAPWVKLFAQIFESLMWVGIAILILLGIIFRKQILGLLKPLQQKNTEETYEAPEVLFGLDVRPELLPSNPAEQARQLWEAKQYREALSLLYRVALVRLTRQHKIEIQHFHTEEDVLRLTQAKLPDLAQQHLKHLTRCWQHTAYGHTQPRHDAIGALIHDWEELANKEVSS